MDLFSDFLIQTIECLNNQVLSFPSANSPCATKSIFKIRTIPSSFYQRFIIYTIMEKHGFTRFYSRILTQKILLTNTGDKDITIQGTDDKVHSFIQKIQEKRIFQFRPGFQKHLPSFPIGMEKTNFPGR